MGSVPKLFLSLLMIAPLFLQAGCVSEGGLPPAKHAKIELPWYSKNPPKNLTKVCDSLKMYYAKVSRLPGSLDKLSTLPEDMYLGGYTYHSRGIGILQEGWRVVVADNVLINESFLWCVLKSPLKLKGSAVLYTALVPVDELMLAGASAGTVPKVPKGP